MADRFCQIHFVSLKNGQVTQVRLFWDQATLLKQLEVIGRTGRNWPIKDGKDQVLMIRRSVEAQGFSSSESSAPATGNAAPARTAQTSQPTQSGPSTRSSSPKPEYNNQGRIRNDGRTPINLYGDDEEVARPIQPRGNSGYRPPSRDLAAILGDDSEEQRSHPTQVVAPKARSSFSRGQSFDVGEAHDAHNNKHIHPKGQNSMVKGQTFSLGSYDEDDQDNGRSAAVNNRPLTNISNTQTQAQSNAQRNDGHHFEIADNSPANNKRAQKPQDNDDEDNFFSQMSSTRAERGIRIAGNGQGNRNDQTQAQSHAQRNDGHFDIGYNTPEKPKRAQKPQDNDDEDNFFSQMSATRTEAGIRIAGNGQGNRNDQTQAQSNAQRNDGHFDIGYNSPENTKRAPKPQDNDDEDNFFSQMSSTRTESGIRISGNGQGNRKATESHWGHGDNSPRAPMPGKQQRVEAEKEKDTTGGGFWDY